MNQEKLLSEYKNAFTETVQLRKDFSQKDGYIREKTGEELALQKAKKIFGEFTPENTKGMERNNNNGKGYDIVSDDGEKTNIPNQLALYERIVEFNKQKGGFYDERYIKERSLEDYEKLQSTNKILYLAKSAYLKSFSESEIKTAYQNLKKVEEQTKREVREQQKTDKNFNSQAEADSFKKENSAYIKELVGKVEGQEGVAYSDVWLNSEGGSFVAGFNKEDEIITKEPIYDDIEVEIGDGAEERVQDDLEPNENIAKKRVNTNSPVDAKNLDEEQLDENENLAAFVRVRKLTSDVYYWKSKTEIEAFKDKGNRITTQASSDKVVESIIDLAEAKGWNSIDVKGSDEFKKAVWYQANLRGIDVRNYKATEQDRILLKEKMAESEKTDRTSTPGKSSDKEKNELPSKNDKPLSEKKEVTSEEIKNDSVAEVIGKGELPELNLTNVKNDKGRRYSEFLALIEKDTKDVGSPDKLSELYFGKDKDLFNSFRDQVLHDSRKMDFHQAYAEALEDIKYQIDKASDSATDYQDYRNQHIRKNNLIGSVVNHRKAPSLYSDSNSHNQDYVKKQTVTENTPPGDKRLAAQSLVNEEVIDSMSTSTNLITNAAPKNIKQELPTRDIQNSSLVDGQQDLYQKQVKEVNDSLKSSKNIDKAQQLSERRIERQKEVVEVLEKAEKYKELFETKKKSEVIKQEPQLEDVYKLKYAASSFAKSLNLDADTAAKLIDKITTEAISAVAKGTEFNVSSITQPSKQMEQPKEQGRAQ